MSGDLIRQINFRIKCETQSPRLRAVGTSDKKVLQSCLGGPMTRNLVVDKLSERRFEAIQGETSDIVASRYGGYLQRSKK